MRWLRAGSGCEFLWPEPSLGVGVAVGLARWRPYKGVWSPSRVAADDFSGLGGQRTADIQMAFRGVAQSAGGGRPLQTGDRLMGQSRGDAGGRANPRSRQRDPQGRIEANNDGRWTGGGVIDRRLWSLCDHRRPPPPPPLPGRRVLQPEPASQPVGATRARMSQAASSQRRRYRPLPTPADLLQPSPSGARRRESPSRLTGELARLPSRHC